MKKRNVIYNIINIVVLLATAVFFLYEFQNAGELFSEKSGIYTVIIIGVAIIVHALKSIRTYVIIYGADMDLITYLKLYCKVTAVSVVFPFKVGEFFRMYCYGKNLNSLLKGVIIVLLDRFMDTIALITMIFLVWIMNGGQIVPLTYPLLAFLVFVFLIYLAFPNIYKFWKQYILHARATERNLATLKLLEIFNKVYQEITGVSVGRGIILYGLSLMAWAVEIGSLIIIGSQVKELPETMSVYLSATMGGAASLEMSRFIFVSVILVVLVYLVLKIFDCLKRKKGIQ